jgi:hypothetical protein
MHTQSPPARLKGNLLDRLAAAHGTDKWNDHWYTPHYHVHFKRRRKQALKVLEIGVGGYQDTTSGGHSLRMWRDYFPNSTIFSIDIHDKTGLSEERIKIFQGSQDDAAFLQWLSAEHGPFDLIIDDGSHVNSHVITSFQVLFPLLAPNGIYAVEDTQTSYWPYMGFGGDSRNLQNPTTMMGFFKSLTDGLNHEEFVRKGYQPSYFDQHIVSMHFYHNLVFVYKGQNNEGSNLIKNNSAAELLRIAEAPLSNSL